MQYFILTNNTYIQRMRLPPIRSIYTLPIYNLFDNTINYNYIFHFFLQEINKDILLLGSQTMEQLTKDIYNLTNHQNCNSQQFLKNNVIFERLITGPKASTLISKLEGRSRHKFKHEE